MEDDGLEDAACFGMKCPYGADGFRNWLEKNMKKINITAARSSRRRNDVDKDVREAYGNGITDVWSQSGLKFVYEFKRVSGKSQC